MHAGSPPEAALPQVHSAFPAAEAFCPAVPRPRVVLILSCNYSGSHLLGQVLGAHSACADIGELRNLPKFASRRGPNSSGTETRFLDDPLFAGFEQMPAALWHGKLLSRIRASDPAVEVLIDNSKRLDWAGGLIERTDLDVRCVHLLRDPRALARRWKETLAQPRQKRRLRLREAKRAWWRALPILRANEPELHAWRWLRENAAITRFLDRHELSAPLLAYEELVTAPERTLSRLMPALGLAYEPRQLEYWRAPQYGTRKTQWSTDRTVDAPVDASAAFPREVSGEAPGEPAGVSPSRPLHLDLRWQQVLSPDEAASAIARPELREYVADRGYRFGPDGLENTASAST